MLTPAQLTTISRYLKKSGILYEEVHDELIDHFINAIDAKMANQMHFGEALIDVGRQFGGRQGLTYIQNKRIQAANKQYNQNLRQYLSRYVRWPNFPLTLTVVWLLYTLVHLAPNMLAITYTILVITAMPFLSIIALTGKHLWQFMRHQRAMAWSTEGFTLVSRCLETLSISLYPSLLVYFGWMTPKNIPMNSTEQLIFFLLSCITLFLSSVQLNLIIRYAKSTNKTLTYLS